MKAKILTAERKENKQQFTEIFKSICKANNMTDIKFNYIANPKGPGMYTGGKSVTAEYEYNIKDKDSISLFISTLGHELAHIKNNDPLKYFYNNEYRKEKMFFEVRADIEGYNLVKDFITFGEYKQRLIGGVEKQKDIPDIEKKEWKKGYPTFEKRLSLLEKAYAHRDKEGKLSIEGVREETDKIANKYMPKKREKNIKL